MGGPSQELRVIISGDTSQLHKAFGKAGTGAVEMEGKITKAGAGAARSLAKLAASGVGLAGLGAAIVKVGDQTIAFDKSMRNVNSLAQLSEKRFHSLSKEVLNLAGKTAQAPDTLAKGLYDLVSSGFNAHESMIVLASSAKAATAGLTTTEVSTKAVAAVLNAYHKPASEAAHVSDVLFQTVNKGVISFEQLSSTIGDVLPFASSLGIHLSEVGAATATLTKAGISPEETMTRLKNVMVTMLKPGETLSATFHKLGVSSGEALIKQKGFQGALEAVVATTAGGGGLTDAYKKLGVATQEELIKKTGSASKANDALAKVLATNKSKVALLFPNIRSLGGALALTGKNTRGAEQDLRSFGDVTGATDKALKEQSKSISYQWNQIKAVFSSLAIQAGSKLIPTVSTLMDGVGAAVARVKDLGREFKRLRDGDPTGHIKPLTLGVNGDPVGKAKGTIGALGAMIKSGVESIDWNAIGNTIRDGFGAAMDIGDKIAPGVAAGLTTAFSKIDGAKVIGGLVTGISEAMNELLRPSFWIDHFKDIFNLVTFVIPLGKILKIPGFGFLYSKISKPLGDVLVRAVTGIGRGFASAFKTIVDDGILAFLGALAPLAPRTADFLLNLVTRSGNVMARLIGKFKTAGLRAVGALVSALGSAAGRVTGAAGDLVGKIIRGIADNGGRAAARFVTAGWDMAKSILSGIGNGIAHGIGPAIRRGISKIPLIGGVLSGLGEGIGRTLHTSAPAPGAGIGAVAGGLHGARAGMQPFASIGARFGLHVSSGRDGRVGKLTSSGNQSWHSTGEAIDLADGKGPDASKLRFFRYMKENYGTKLAELIYTPGGAGVKNGQAYTYTGAVAADHFDHVHVAFDLGKTGQGDGHGRNPFTGDGVGVAASAARSAGFRGTDLVNIVAIAGRESGWVPTKTNMIPPDHSIGLWQINQLAHKGRYGTDAELKNPSTNARAAYALFKAAGLSPWKGPSGSPFDNVTKDMFAQARAAVVGGRGDTGATSGSGRAAGPSRSDINDKLDANQNQLDALRNALGNLPTGKAGKARRATLRGQINTLVAANRGLRSDLRDIPSNTDATRAAELAGSRIVNRVVQRYSKAIRRTGGAARKLGTEIEDADSDYGRAERFDSQVLGGRAGDYGEEDLGTAKGRADRTTEITALKALKAAQKARMEKRKVALKATIDQYKKMISAMYRKRNKAHGHTRTAINTRIKSYEAKLIEYEAEYKSLGGSIADTQLDMNEQDAELASVAATPDTPDTAAQDAVQATQDAYDKYISDRGSIAQSSMSLAQLTTDTGDDIVAMGLVVNDAQQTYAEASAKFGAGSAEAAAAFVGLATAVKSLEQVTRDAVVQGFQAPIDALDAALVRAQVDTPNDQRDDIGVVTQQLADATAGYMDAVARGDSEAIKQFGGEVLSLRGSLESLQNALSANTSALADMAKEMAVSNAIAKSTVGIELATAYRAFGDFVSGQIGYKTTGRSMLAGDGRAARY